jgi:hypothetical protein
VIRTLAAINLALALACVAHNAHAGPFAPPQRPDNFSNLEYHAGGHFVIGIVVATAKPEWHPLTQWAVCQIPGAIHELSPSPGNYRSTKDMIANAAGCALGGWAGRGFGIAPTTAGGARVTYSVEFP